MAQPRGRPSNAKGLGPAQGPYPLAASLPAETQAGPTLPSRRCSPSREPSLAPGKFRAGGPSRSSEENLFAPFLALCAAGSAPSSPRCRSRPASPNCLARDSRAAIVPVGFPLGPVEGAELALFGALADSLDGGAGLLAVANGPRRHQARDHPAMTGDDHLFSPCSTRSSKDPRVFFASKAPT